MKYFLTMLKALFWFKGRTSRSGFWLVSIIYYLFVEYVMKADYGITNLDYYNINTTNRDMLIINKLMNAAITIIMMWVFTVQAVKRLHDLGYSSYFVLVLPTVAILFWNAVLLANNNVLGLKEDTATYFYSIWIVLLFIFLIVMKGENEENKFGRRVDWFVGENKFGKEPL